MNAGEIKISLLLENKIFGEQIKTSLSLLKIFKTNATDILKGIPVTFQVSDIDKALQKEEQALKKLQTEIDRTDTSTKQFRTSTVSLSDKISGAGLRVDGFRAILDVLKATMGNLVGEYNKQEVAISKLENGLKNVGEGADALNRLSKQASDLQLVTPFADEDINNAQAMLTTFQKNSKEIEILTPRILDLAAAFQTSGESGMDLQQVAVLLGKVNEETIGGLRRVGVAFTKEQEEKLKSTKGTEQAIYLSQILDQNFKGMAETVGNTAAGQMKIFDNKLGEVKESLGKILSEAIKPLLKPLGDFLQTIADADQPTKMLTIAVLGLASAFVVLNTSMGGIPYIIGAVIYTLAATYAKFKETGSIVRATEADFSSFGSAVLTIMQSILFPIGQVKLAILLVSKAIDDIIVRWNALKNLDFGTVIEPELHERPDGSELSDTQEAKRMNTSFKEVPKQQEKPKDLPPAPKIKTGGGSDAVKETKIFTSVLDELEKQLKDLQSTIDRQTEGENIVDKLYGKKKDLEDKIKQIKEINELGLIGYGKKLHQAELDKGIKLPEKRIGGTFGEGALDDIKPLDTTEDARVTFKDKLDASLGLASQITSILGLGADNFINKFIGGLRDGIGLVTSIAKLLGLFASGGATGFLSFLGFADGGSVPGTGSGDTVPAMLTPGEYVINKSRAGMLGSRFLNWLNGGGTVQSMAPGAFVNFGSVTRIIQVPYIMSHDVKGQNLRTILTRVDKSNGRRAM